MPAPGVRSAKRSSRASRPPGPRSSAASARTALLSWPMAVAAPRPRPTTSPTTTASRPGADEEHVPPVPAHLEHLDAGAVDRGDLEPGVDRGARTGAGPAAAARPPRRSARRRPPGPAPVPPAGRPRGRRPRPGGPPPAPVGGSSTTAPQQLPLAAHRQDEAGGVAVVEVGRAGREPGPPAAGELQAPLAPHEPDAPGGRAQRPVHRREERLDDAVHPDRLRQRGRHLLQAR